MQQSEFYQELMVLLKPVCICDACIFKLLILVGSHSLDPTENTAMYITVCM